MSVAAGAFAQGFASTFMPIFMAGLQRRGELQDRAADRALQMDMLVKQNEHLLEREERARFHEITLLLVQNGDVEGAAAMLEGMDLPPAAMAGVRRAVQNIADVKALERAGALHENMVGEVTRITEEIMPYIREDPRFFITGVDPVSGKELTVPNIIGLTNPMTGEVIAADDPRTKQPTGAFKTYDALMGTAKEAYAADFWARIPPGWRDSETGQTAYRMWIIDNPPVAPVELGMPVQEAEVAGIEADGEGLGKKIVDWIGRAAGEVREHGPVGAVLENIWPTDQPGGDQHWTTPRDLEAEPPRERPTGGMLGGLLGGEGWGEPSGYFRRDEPAPPPTSVIGTPPSVTPPAPADNVGYDTLSRMLPGALTPTPPTPTPTPTPPALHERPGTAAPTQPFTPPRPSIEGQAFAPQQAQGTVQPMSATGQTPVHERMRDAPMPAPAMPPTGQTPVHEERIAPDPFIAEAQRRAGEAPAPVAQPGPPPAVPSAIPSPGVGGPAPTLDQDPFAETPMLWDQPAAAQTTPAAAPELAPPAAPEPQAAPPPLDDLLGFPRDDRELPPQMYWGDESVGVPTTAEAPLAQPVADTAGAQPGTTLAVSAPAEMTEVMAAIEGADQASYQDGDQTATYFGIANGIHGLSWDPGNPGTFPTLEEATAVMLSLLEPGSTFDDAVVAAFGPDLPARERTALVIAAYRWGGRGFRERIAAMPEFVAAVRNRDPAGVARGFNALSGDRRGKVETAIFFEGLPPAGADVIQWSDDFDKLIRDAK